jgi:glucan phosphoethanolaminetransferase (alkaline phosphatase superfamily)
MDKDKQIEHKAITLAHKPLIVYVVTALMITTSMIYFYLAYEDYQQLLQSSSSSASADDIQSTRNEIIFFLVVAISYIPISIWMLKVKHSSKIPHMIAIVVSAGLIVFYILTRLIDILSIGLQTDVGTTDIATKILQGAIVAISSFLVVSVVLRRKRLENNPTNQYKDKYRNNRK